MNYQEFFHGEDWNVLVILDACRYDSFEKCTTIKGTLRKIHIPEISCTIEWLMKTFTEKYPYTYVSGSPVCTSKIVTRPSHSEEGSDGFLGSAHFTRVVDLWRTGWSRIYKTIYPRYLTNCAKHYLHKKKLILHYMQPHLPGIGETKLDFVYWVPDKHGGAKIKDSYYNHRGKDGMVRKGVIERFDELFEQVYYENLEIVLEEMKRLLTFIPPEHKVVITSDHGEMLGEDDKFGHPGILNGYRHPKLNTIPWFEVKK